MIAVRFPNFLCEESLLIKECQSLIASTCYQYTVSDKEAPQLTNCVTAIRYLFLKLEKVFLPPVWIGDMPRTLITRYGCTLEDVTATTLKRGDLLFLRRSLLDDASSDKRWITHIMLAVSCDRIFHSSSKRGGAAFENLRECSDEYVINLKKLLVDDSTVMRYIDPRNQKMRSIFKCAFIPIEVSAYFVEPSLPKEVRKIIEAFLIPIENKTE